jgi:acyl-CoA thioester hydrolase
MQGRPNFSASYRVYYEDTDAGGVVYYANYLKYMERCRTDWLGALGIDQWKLRQERNVQFAVVNLDVNYLRPAKLGDDIRVTAVLTRLTAVTFSFEQEIWRGEDQLVKGNTRVACLDSLSLKPRAIPSDLFKEWRDEQ